MQRYISSFALSGYKNRVKFRSYTLLFHPDFSPYFFSNNSVWLLTHFFVCESYEVILFFTQSAFSFPISPVHFPNLSPAICGAFPAVLQNHIGSNILFFVSAYHFQIYQHLPADYKAIVTDNLFFRIHYS